MKKEERPALLLIDIQKAFHQLDYWGGSRNNPNAEANASKLLTIWRQKGLPVFHVQHCSTEPGSLLAPGSAGNDFQDVVKPDKGETIIKKHVNSAFIGTDLKQLLDTAGIDTVVIVGLTTDHCVSTTTRMAGNYGYKTFIVSDATATFNKTGADGQKYTAEIIHATALASLHGEFATVLKTDDVIENLQNK